MAGKKSEWLEIFGVISYFEVKPDHISDVSIYQREKDQGQAKFNSGTAETRLQFLIKAITNVETCRETNTAAVLCHVSY